MRGKDTETNFFNRIPGACKTFPTSTPRADIVPVWLLTCHFSFRVDKTYGASLE